MMFPVLSKLLKKDKPWPVSLHLRSRSEVYETNGIKIGGFTAIITLHVTYIQFIHLLCAKMSPCNCAPELLNNHRSRRAKLDTFGPIQNCSQVWSPSGFRTLKSPHCSRPICSHVSTDLTPLDPTLDLATLNILFSMFISSILSFSMFLSLSILFYSIE